MNNIIKRVWNQNRMVNIEDLTGAAFQAENGGHTFEIVGIDDTGAAVELSGTVAGVFRRPDNADIALTGSASGGVVSVTLSEDCYAVPGRFGLTVFVTSDSQKVAVYACVGTVAGTSGGSVAGSTPADVVDLINAINAAVATIPSSYTDLMAAVAPDYSSSALYAQGSYAWNGGVLYRNKIPVTVAETFNSSKWIAASIGNDVGKHSRGMPYVNLWLVGDLIDNRAVSSSGGTTSNPLFMLSDYIPVSPGDVIYGRGGRFACYDSSRTFISGTTFVLNNLNDDYALPNGMHFYTIPEGAAWFRICANKTTTPDQFYCRIASELSLYTLLKKETPLKYYAIGDSITRGMWAAVGSSSSGGVTEQSYPYWIAEINNFTLTNLGVSGSGYANKGGNTSDESGDIDGKYVVDNNDISDADIITIAYGINDYKGDAQSIVLGDMTSTAGDGTVIGNMKYMINKINTVAPTAQVIILLPMNQNRMGYASMSEANNWSFGYAFRDGKTLTDYRNAIKECADYYNIKVVDTEEVCPINRLNIRSVLGDGLHPTKAFHKQMGKALAPYIH
jgi:lysophospholipase L1-like esterase